jgi:formylglycine-generating enzyme required for sulfatase activity
MISNYGVEGCAGVMWQWLNDTGYRFDAATAHTHTFSSISGDAGSYTSGTASADVAPAWSYKANTGGKGSLYTQGTYGTIKLLAGGNWNHGAHCGSRSRYANYSPWNTASSIGFRVITNTIEK